MFACREGHRCAIGQRHPVDGDRAAIICAKGEGSGGSDLERSRVDRAMLVVTEADILVRGVAIHPAHHAADDGGAFLEADGRRCPSEEVLVVGFGRDQIEAAGHRVAKRVAGGIEQARADHRGLGDGERAGVGGGGARREVIPTVVIVGSHRVADGARHGRSHGHHAARGKARVFRIHLGGHTQVHWAHDALVERIGLFLAHQEIVPIATRRGFLVPGRLA